MAEQEEKPRPSETFRQRRRAEGQRQVQIWLDENLSARADTLIRAGQFRNRSELITAALSTMLERTGM